jgi:transposase
MIKFLKKQIEKVSAEIDALINADPTQKAKRKILEEVDGIGSIISSSLLALLPELGLTDRRRIASLVGVAPHPYESGETIGYRRTKGGREEVRSILYMGAMTASRTKGRIGEFYRRLVAQGKKKMVALIAVMRKILVIANAKLAEWYKSQINETCHE